MNAPQFPITVTARHMDLTDAIRDYATEKLQRLNFEHPRIVDAKVIVDAQSQRHRAEMVVHCAQVGTLEADSETRDLYEAIDQTVAKMARLLRKEKTRQLKRREQ